MALRSFTVWCNHRHWPFPELKKNKNHHPNQKLSSYSAITSLFSAPGSHPSPFSAGLTPRGDGSVRLSFCAWRTVLHSTQPSASFAHPGDGMCRNLPPVRTERGSRALLVQHLSVDAGCRYLSVLLSNAAGNMGVDSIFWGYFYLDISPFLCYTRCLLCDPSLS